MVTTIQLDEKVKRKLEKLKVHHRESYNELLMRMIEVFSQGDKKGMIETIEIMSNPETMRNIAQGIEDYKKGRGITLEELEKELDL